MDVPVFMRGIPLFINELGDVLLNYQDEGVKAASMPRYRPFSVGFAWRRIDPPIRIDGALRSRYTAPVVVEYVDMETGEILDASKVKGEPEFWPELHFGERFLQRQEVLGALRQEVSQFARFVLAFRNLRRGITPGIDALVKWYALLHGRAAHHVRRNVERLLEGGILSGEALVAPLFQKPGKSTSARHHLAEDAKAQLKFAGMLLRRCQGSSEAIPFWLREMEIEMTRIVEKIMQRVLASQNKGSRYWEFHQDELEDEGWDSLYEEADFLLEGEDVCLA